MKKLVIYTAIFGGKDHVHEPVDVPGADFYLFTDDKSLKSKYWDVVIDDPALVADPRRKSRFFKMMPHELFPEYEYSLWIDGNQKLVKNPAGLIERYLTQNVSVAHVETEFGWYRHSQGAYGEAELCIRLCKDDRGIISDQVDFYRTQGLPDGFPLWGCRAILRRHNSQNSVKLNELWWNQINRFSSRDQISFPYCVWKLDIPVITMINIDKYILKHLHNF